MGTDQAFDYDIAGMEFNIESASEMDLWVDISSNLTEAKHTMNIVEEASYLLVTVRIAFKYMNKMFMKILTTYVRPKLEYAPPAWFSYWRKYKELLKKVWRNALRMFSE